MLSRWSLVLVLAIALAIPVTSPSTVAAEPSHAADSGPSGGPCDSVAIATRAMSDVAPQGVHTNAIRCMIAYEIINGRADGTFGPTLDLTRGQMASLLARFLTVANPEMRYSQLAEQPFGDVVGSAHERSIGILSESGIVQGVSDTEFRPNSAVSRGQMASFVYRTLHVLDVEIDRTQAHDFTDVLPSSVHAEAIQSLSGQGIIRGLSSTSFGPHRTLDRQQAASLLMRTALALHERERWPAARATGAEATVEGVVSGHQPGGFEVPAGQTWEIEGEVTTPHNVVVHGTLKMRSGATLTFVDIDEDAVVGGHAQGPVTSDVGLWVFGDGRLDIEGTPKQGWNTTGSHPTWSSDDEYLRAPHGTAESGPQPWSWGDEVPCTNYGDEQVCAEIVNRTRDVVIQGTESGKTHVFIHSSQPQTVKHAAIRHVGIDHGGPSGRYGLHFHHAGEGSRGSMIEGVLIERSGAHAFVPHASHGIMFKDTVALRTTNAAYWWDPDTSDTFPLNATNDTVYDRALALDVQGGYQSNEELTGFYLGQGRGNKAIASAAVDIASRTSGRQRESSGFYVPRSAQSLPNVWELRDLVSHHNSNGTFTRRNRVRAHPEPGARFDGFTAYQNREWGVYVGPYRDNVAVYDARLFENAKLAVRHRTGAGGKGAEAPYDNTFTGVMDAAGGEHVILLNSSSGGMAEDVSVVWRDLTLRGWTETPIRVAIDNARNHDFISVDANGRDLEPSDFRIGELVSDNATIRVQRSDGTAFQIDTRGVADIEPFS